MKLSQMTGEELRRTLCELAPPMCAVLQDPRTHALLDQLMDKSVPLASLAAQFLGQGIPLLLEDHRVDTLAVLSALTGISADALQSMNAFSLIRLVKESFDAELAAFFACAGPAAQEKS